MSQETKEPSTAAVSAAPRPQFKKVKKKSKARLRTRTENDDDDHDSSTVQAIEQTRKKRKLLNEVLYKKGIDATLKTSSETAVIQETDSSKKETDLTLTFAGGGGDATAEGGVLQRKHKNAMEEFIQENLKQTEVPKEREQESSANKSDTDKLYAELASASQKLAGTATATLSGEGDVGAGGAMLGGTGIAEVTLPADDRIQTIKDTQEAVSSFPTAGKRSSAVPQDTADSNRGSDDISNVPSSYSHNFQLHTQEWVQQKKQEEEATNVVAPAIQQQQQDLDGERMGFEAARRLARGVATSTTAPGAQEKNRSGDDRAWKNFMTRQQQNRDRY